MPFVATHEPAHSAQSPIAPGALERDDALDVIRGVALLGVLLVNLETIFRVPLFRQILVFHTHDGWLNHALENLIAGLFEFKAIMLFSLLFGVGVAIQHERAGAAGASPSRFLARRFAVLAAIGAVHMLLIWRVACAQARHGRSCCWGWAPWGSERTC